MRKFLTRRVLWTESDSLGHFLSKSGRVSLIKRRRVQFSGSQKGAGF
jgi:hypothetical protein